MPPRKSNISQISATDPDGAGTPLKERDGINIEDLSLPKTMVQRLAKGVLPPNTSLGKDAIVAMQKGATVFINYLAQAANTSTTNANKRTIPPRAVLEALVDLEYEPFVPRVEAELEKYNEVQVGKRNEYRRKVKEEKMGGVKGEEGGSGVEAEAEAEEGRATKRVRREEGEGGAGDGHEQLLVGNGYAEREEEEEGDEENADEGADDGDDDTANTSRELRPRRSEEAEDDEEEDEEEEDDEDEYPDEGRRLSSVEREAHEGGDTRSPRYDDPNDEEEEDDEGLSDISD